MSRSAEVDAAERGGVRGKEACMETGAAPGELCVRDAGTGGLRGVLIADGGSGIEVRESSVSQQQSKWSRVDSECFIRPAWATCLARGGRALQAEGHMCYRIYS